MLPVCVCVSAFPSPQPVSFSPALSVPLNKSWSGLVSAAPASVHMHAHLIFAGIVALACMHVHCMPSHRKQTHSWPTFAAVATEGPVVVRVTSGATAEVSPAHPHWLHLPSHTFHILSSFHSGRLNLTADQNTGPSTLHITVVRRCSVASSFVPFLITMSATPFVRHPELQTALRRIRGCCEVLCHFPPLVCSLFPPSNLRQRL